MKEQVKEQKKEHEHLDYARKYKIITLILFFFTFSMIGWLWEVSLHIVQNGKFVNRGVLHGPWLPIYGTGGVLVLILLRKVFHNPVLTFFLTMTIASIVEYFTSWYLEFTKGIRWWDYSGYFLNLNGRICLEGAVIFGLGGCLIVYLVAPRLAKLYEQIPFRIQIFLCVVLIGAFLIDQGYSKKYPNTGEGITDYQYNQKNISSESPNDSITYYFLSERE